MQPDVDQNYSDSDEDEVVDSTPEREPELERRYPKRDRKKRVDPVTEYQQESKAKKPRKLRKKDQEKLIKMDFWYSWYKWSDCKLAKQYDEERNFFPQPGPSNLNYYEDDNIAGYYRPLSNSPGNSNGRAKSVEKASISNSVEKTSATKRVASKSVDRSTVKKRSTSPPQRHSSRKSKARKLNDTKSNSNSPVLPTGIGFLTDDSDWENDIHVQSFYEQSFVANSPALTQTDNFFNGDDTMVNGSESNSQSESLANTTISTPIISKFLENLKNSSSELKPKRVSLRRKTVGACTIKPRERAPHPAQAKKMLNSNELPKEIHPVPFYSDPNDVIANNSKKEIGHTVLRLTGIALTDCEEFKSQLNVMGMSTWQHMIGMKAIRCSQRMIDSKVLQNTDTIRQFLSKETPVWISPSFIPPSKQNVRNWLDMRAQSNKKKRTSDRYPAMNGDHDDSPVKIRREKAISALNDFEDITEVVSKPQGAASELIRVLRSKTELTVSMVPKRTNGKILKSQSDDENKTQCDSDEADEVICLDDQAVKQKPNPNAFSKLVRSTR